MNHSVKRKQSPDKMLLEKPMPQNLDAEQGLLSAFLIHHEAVYDAVDILSPDDFYSESHKSIYRAILTLIDENIPVDMVTVSDALSKDGVLDRVGTSAYKGITYLAWLIDAVPMAVNVPHYAQIVKGKSINRRLISAGYEITKKALDAQSEPSEILDWAENQIFQIASDRGHGRFYRIGELLEETIEDIEKIQGRKNKVTGVPSGFYEVDKLTSGFQPSDLIVLAARPSVGKTAFALNIARNVAVEHGVPVGILSIEMSRQHLSRRMVATEAKISSGKIMNGWYSKEVSEAVEAAATVLEPAPIYIDEAPVVSAIEARAKARRLKLEKNIGLFIIDYLQLMRASSSFERREREIAEISRSLKSLAKELNIPVIALSQLNRKVEDRSDKRPMLSDLRESGALEQDADVVAFIYRDDMYHSDENNPKRGTAEIIVSKHRNGPTGTATVGFMRDYTLFYNLFLDKNNDF